MSTTTTTPCRVPPAGGRPTAIRPHLPGGAAGHGYTEALTVGDKLVQDHQQGRVHFAPLCRLCSGAA